MMEVSLWFTSTMQPFCLSLESIYADAADLSCDAGGLLLELRNVQTFALDLRTAKHISATCQA